MSDMDLKTRVEMLPCGKCEDMLNCDDCYHQKEAQDIYQQIRADAIDECIDIVTDHNALMLSLGYERIVNDMKQLKEQECGIQ